MKQENMVQKEFKGMKTNKNVYVVMIDDVDADADFNIQECTVWSNKEKAIQQLKAVMEDYKENTLKDYLNNNDVSFTLKNTEDKHYIMLDCEESFSFYEAGRHRDNHIEVWILAKVIDGDIRRLI